MRALLLPIACLAATTGCRDLERFDTEGEAAYCGSLVSAPSFHEGFVASGATPDLQMRLTLDTAKLMTVPGTLSSSDAAHGLCSGDERALFENAPLRGIPEIYHDALSALKFGEGHEDDFFAWVDSTCQGTMLGLVSLLRGGDVELRLFKPASLPAPDAGPEKRPGYALFYLKREETGCNWDDQ